jgi:hypothetical protein
LTPRDGEIRYNRRVAGRSTSEEMDAVSFDDVTPPRPVSIYDLDEDIPTRMQSSDEIAEYQRKARERRDPAHRSFRKTSEPVAAPSGRPIPRESGPVLIERARPSPAPAPAPEPELDLDEVLNDVAATISKLPPAPRMPSFDPRDVPASVRDADTHSADAHGADAHEQPTRAVAAVTPPQSRSQLVWALGLFVLTLSAIALFAVTR